MQLLQVGNNSIFPYLFVQNYILQLATPVYEFIGWDDPGTHLLRFVEMNYLYKDFVVVVVVDVVVVVV